MIFNYRSFKKRIISVALSLSPPHRSYPAAAACSMTVVEMKIYSVGKQNLFWFLFVCFIYLFSLGGKKSCLHCYLLM